MNTGFCVRLSVRMKDGFEGLVLFLVFFFQVKISSMCLEIVCVCTQASAWWWCEGGGSLGAGGDCRFCTGIAVQGLPLRAMPPPLPAGGTGAAPALAVSLGGRQAITRGWESGSDTAGVPAYGTSFFCGSSHSTVRRKRVGQFFQKSFRVG